MEQWLEKMRNTTIRYLVYRRMFTPYEQEQAAVFESQFESTHYSFGRIADAVNLGNGDWLLGIRGTYGDDFEYAETGITAWLRLSDIRIEVFDIDQPDYKAPAEAEE